MDSASICAPASGLIVAGDPGTGTTVLTHDNADTGADVLHDPRGKSLVPDRHNDVKFPPFARLQGAVSESQVAGEHVAQLDQTARTLAILTRFIVGGAGTLPIRWAGMPIVASVR